MTLQNLDKIYRFIKYKFYTFVYDILIIIYEQCLLHLHSSEKQNDNKLIFKANHLYILIFFLQQHLNKFQ
jgi:hypothetical protein